MVPTLVFEMCGNSKRRTADLLNSPALCLLGRFTNRPYERQHVPPHAAGDFATWGADC